MLIRWNREISETEFLKLTYLIMLLFIMSSFVAGWVLKADSRIPVGIRKSTVGCRARTEKSLGLFLKNSMSPKYEPVGYDLKQRLRVNRQITLPSRIKNISVEG
jgi:hypothetical protein